jgi:hypothetical protein
MLLALVGLDAGGPGLAAGGLAGGALALHSPEQLQKLVRARARGCLARRKGCPQARMLRRELELGGWLAGRGGRAQG